MNFVRVTFVISSEAAEELDKLLERRNELVVALYKARNRAPAATEETYRAEQKIGTILADAFQRSFSLCDEEKNEEDKISFFLPRAVTDEVMDLLNKRPDILKARNNPAAKERINEICRHLGLLLAYRNNGIHVIQDMNSDKEQK